MDKTSEVGDYAELALHLLDHYCIRVLSVIIKLNSRCLAGIWAIGELAGVRKKRKKTHLVSEVFCEERELEFSALKNPLIPVAFLCFLPNFPAASRLNNHIWSSFHIRQGG